MARNRRCKCRNCKELFVSDVRNRGRQKYCFKSKCRKASKKSSQQKWLAGKGDGYFQGKAQSERVQRWRERNPDYARRKSVPAKKPLQDPLITQPPEDKEVKPSFVLQDPLSPYLPLLVGLMSHLAGEAGETLQDSMESMARSYTSQGYRLLEQGFRIPYLEEISHEHQTPAVSGAPSQASPAVQLDRPAPGAG